MSEFHKKGVRTRSIQWRLENILKVIDKLISDKSKIVSIRTSLCDATKLWDKLQHLGDHADAKLKAVTQVLALQ